MKITFSKVGDRMEVTQADCDNFIEVELFKSWYSGNTNFEELQKQLDFKEEIK